MLWVLVVLAMLLGVPVNAQDLSSPVRYGKQNLALMAPITAIGNYGTGCGGSSCLLMDDHWTNRCPGVNCLDSTKWWAGLYFDGFGYIDPFWGSGCGPGPAVYWSVAVPLSSWHSGVNCNGSGSTEYAPYYDYPYLLGSTNAPSLDWNPLQIASDGTLEYTWSTNTFWSGNSGYDPQPISASITSRVAIPQAGGLVQFRFKEDSGLRHGSWPIVQCSADKSWGFNDNFEMEWGGFDGFDAATYIKLSLDNGSPTADLPVTSGGDLTNWHIFAMEYEGDGTKNVNFYYDGVKVQTETKAESGYNFYCYFGFDVMSSGGNSYHSAVDLTNYPPPYHHWISDIQIYKKPGT